MLIDGFADDIIPPTEQDRALMAKMPWNDQRQLEEAGLSEFLTGVRGQAAVERVLELLLLLLRLLLLLLLRRGEVGAQGGDVLLHLLAFLRGGDAGDAAKRDQSASHHPGPSQVAERQAAQGETTTAWTITPRRNDAARRRRSAEHLRMQMRPRRREGW